MRRLSIFFCLLINTFPVFAASLDFSGEYSKRSAVRIFGTKEFCDSEHGEYNAAEKSCIMRSNGNSVSILKNSDGKTLVHVETIWGAANMREFDGVVTKTGKSSLEAHEVELNDNGTIARKIKKGCVLKVSFSSNGKANVIPGKNCDAGLHIEGAEKSNPIQIPSSVNQGES